VTKAAVATAFALLAGRPLSASAVPILTFSLKIIPTDLRQGSVVEFPLVLVENRSPDSDTSLFDGDPLAAVGGTLQSLQSTFISVTPAAGFDTRQNVFVSDNEIGIDFASSAGIPVTVDNSGIVGRTEIPLGTVKMEIGAPLQVMDPPVVFRVDLASDHSTSQNAARYLGPGIQESLGGVFSSVIEFLAPIRPDVIIDGDPTRTVTRAKLRLKGTADAIGTVKTVEAKIGSAAYQKLTNVSPTGVAGRVKWVFPANLALGSNKIKLRSIDDVGEISDVARVKVIRKSP
jgi:hypothetical protein